MKGRQTHLRFGERERFMLAMILPAFLVLIAFQVLPILIGANASFRFYPLFNPTNRWVGLKNYITVLTDPVFYGKVLPNTFIFMGVAVSCELVAGLVLAVMLNRDFRGARLVRTTILLPLMVAPVIAAMMIGWMFNDQFGVVDAALKAMGFSTPVWLLNRWTAMAIVILTDIWLWTPWFTIILLAGLRSLPEEPREAAMLDGASAWKIFWNITLPLLRPVLLVGIVLRAIDAFRVFDIVWVITEGEPARSTEVFSVYAYKQAFVYLNFDQGMAACIIGALVIRLVGGILYKGFGYFLEVSR
jgi:multiple sugar transport system permease protein